VAGDYVYVHFAYRNGDGEIARRAWHRASVMKIRRSASSKGNNVHNNYKLRIRMHVEVEVGC
jgi:hypothetical protein